MAGKAVVRTEVRADTKHFEVHMHKAQKAADNVRKAQGRLDKQNSTIARGFQRAAAGASVLNGPLNGVSGRLNAIATALRLTNVGYVALGGAVSTLGVALTGGVKSLANYEVQMKRVEAVQKATGYAAGFTGEQIHDMAQDIAMSTLASVDGVMSAAAALGTFGSISGEAFEKTLRLSQDVAEAMGTDMQGATIQLGKALEDPTRGLTALSRAGVTFTQGTRDQIAAAVEFGDTLKAQGLILDQVEAQLGGVGAAVADDTLIGGWDSFTQHLETFLRQSTAVNWVLDKLKKVITGVNEALGRYNASGPVNELDAAWRKVSDATLAYQRQLKATSATHITTQSKREQMFQAERDWQAALVTAQKEAVETEKARIAGIAQQQEKAQEDRLAAYEKYKARHNKIDARYDQERARLAAQANTVKWRKEDPAGSLDSALGAEGSRLEKELAKERAYFEKIAEQEKLHGAQLEMWRAESDANELLIIEGHLNRVNDLHRKAAEDKASILQQEYDLKELIADKEEAFMRRQMQGYADLASQVGATFSAISGWYDEGSKAAKAFAVASQAASLMATLANVAEGISVAFKSPNISWYEQAAAVASATALGAQIIGMATSARGSRALGGPAMPGTYWVGERGPELVHFNQPAHVTKASETGGVTVNLIEDASRAGQSSVDEAGIVQIAVASIRGELQRDLASGRGLFRQAEQQYGLNRAR